MIFRSIDRRRLKEDRCREQKAKPRFENGRELVILKHNVNVVMHHYGNLSLVNVLSKLNIGIPITEIKL